MEGTTFHPEEEDLEILTAFGLHKRASKLIPACISSPFAVSSSFAVSNLLLLSVNSSNLQIHPKKSLKKSTFFTIQNSNRASRTPHLFRPILYLALTSATHYYYPDFSDAKASQKRGNQDWACLISWWFSVLY